MFSVDLRGSPSRDFTGCLWELLPLRGERLAHLKQDTGCEHFRKAHSGRNNSNRSFAGEGFEN